MKISHLLFSFTFIILFFPLFSHANNLVEEDFTVETVEKSSDDKKNDKTRLFLNYLVTLHKQGVLEESKLQGFLDNLQAGKVINPLRCSKKEKKCKEPLSATQVHAPEIDKYLLKSDTLNMSFLKKGLEEFLSEIDSERIAKKNAVSKNFRVDKVEFHTLKGGPYYHLGYMEESEEEEIRSLNDPYIKNLYKFARFELNDAFELQSTLVSQRFFSEIMGYNPSYDIEFDSKLKKDELWSEIVVKGKKVKFQNKLPVTGIKVSDLKDFLEALNSKDKQKEIKELSDLSKEGKCTFDVLSKDQFDYIKSHWVKDFRFFERKQGNSVRNYDAEYNLEKIRVKNLLLNFEATYFERFENGNDNKYISFIEVRSHFFSLTEDSKSLKRIAGIDFNLFNSNSLFLFNENYNLKDALNLSLFDPEKIIEDKAFSGILGNKKLYIKNKGDNYFSVGFVGKHKGWVCHECVVFDMLTTFIDKTAYISDKSFIFRLRNKNTKSDEDSIMNYFPQDYDYRENSILLTRKCN